MFVFFRDGIDIRVEGLEVHISIHRGGLSIEVVRKANVFNGIHKRRDNVDTIVVSGGRIRPIISEGEKNVTSEKDVRVDSDGANHGRVNFVLSFIPEDDKVGFIRTKRDVFRENSGIGTNGIREAKDTEADVVRKEVGIRLIGVALISVLGIGNGILAVSDVLADIQAEGNRRLSRIVVVGSSIRGSISGVFRRKVHGDNGVRPTVPLRTEEDGLKINTSVSEIEGVDDVDENDVLGSIQMDIQKGRTIKRNRYFI